MKLIEKREGNRTNIQFGESMKEQIIKDIGDAVVIPDVYDKSRSMTGIISMITVTKSGIKYRATFDGNSICAGKHQCDFWQEDILT